MSDELLRATARLLISLPLVALLAYLVIKFGFGRRTIGLQKKRRMQVIEQVSLSPKVSMSLVRVGDKYFLLAHQEQSTVVVKEMDEMPAEIEQDSTSPVTANFFAALSKKIKQKDKHEDYPGESGRHEK